MAHNLKILEARMKDKMNSMKEELAEQEEEIHTLERAKRNLQKEVL